jgi:alpha-mannosidase
MAEPVIHVVDNRHYRVVFRKTLEECADTQEWHLLKVVELMRNYPQYKFTTSQAIVLANFIVRHFDLEQELKIRLNDGQLGVVGGSYTIPDTNMISGEALYRNLLLGLEYFRRHFEYEVQTASFEGASGRSGQIPQMLRTLGFRHVAGSVSPGLRLQCEDGSQPPDSPRSYMWEGLDGSRIPVYVPTINAGPTRFYPEPFQETFRTKESFELLGIYRELLTEARKLDENAIWLQIWDEERKLDEELVDAVWEERRKKDHKPIAFALPGDYMDAVAAEPVPALHRGELNPVHTGIYTTRIGMKQASVRLENLIVEVEKWFSIAGTEGMHFPRLKFRDLWYDLFVLQSYPAISGCHTDRVRHRLDSLAHHMQRDLNELRARAVHAICAHIDAPPRGEWRPLHVFNSLNWARKGIVEFRRLGGVQIADDSSNPVPVLNRGDVCYFLAEAPPCGYSTYWYLAGGGQQPREAAQRNFATDFFAVAVADDGGISIRDSRNDTAITREGELWGTILAREDRGSMWCKGYTGKAATSTCSGVRVFRELLGWEVRRTGRVADAPWKEFGSLEWDQSLFFYDSLPFFDMHVDIDWKGSATELRLRLPFGRFAMSSVYGIPYGAAARVPYRDDSLMQAGKSLVQGGEWPACRWVEFGDGDYGITLAHSGTPGIRCEDGAIEISLLRSPIDDPEYSHNFYLAAERGARENGHHHYRFSFLPALGDWRTNGSFNFGYEHQNPLFAYAGPARKGRSASRRSFLDFGPRNLICTAWTVNREGHQLVRIVEAAGSPTELRWGRKPRRAIYHASPFGERLEPADRVMFKPFEIRHIVLA